MAQSRLAIERLTGRYLVPGRLPASDSLQARLDRILMEEVPNRCATVLASLLGEGEDEVWLIRRLDVDLLVDIAAITDEELSREWGEQLARGLAGRIAAGADGVEVRRFEDRAEQAADFLSALAEGRAWSEWWHSEFETLRSLPAGAAVVTLLSREAELAPRVLAQLAKWERLDAVAKLLSEPQATSLLDLLAEAEPWAGSTAVWAAALVALAANWRDRTGGSPVMGPLSAEAVRIFGTAISSDWPLPGDSLPASLRLAAALAVAGDPQLLWTRAVSSGLRTLVTRLSDVGINLPDTDLKQLRRQLTGGSDTYHQPTAERDRDSSPVRRQADRERVGWSPRRTLRQVMAGLPEQQSLLAALRMGELEAAAALLAAAGLSVDGPQLEAYRLEALGLSRRGAASAPPGEPGTGAVQPAAAWLASPRAIVFLLLPALAEIGLTDARWRLLVLAASLGGDKGAVDDPVVQLAAGAAADELKATRRLRVSGRDRVRLAAWLEACRRPPRELDDGDLAYLAPGTLPATPAVALHSARVAAAVMRWFAARAGGFDQASLYYIRRNLLSGEGTVSTKPGLVEIQLAGVPLRIVMQMAGMTRQTYSVPWLEAEVTVEVASE